jgi:hypothetical protein
VVLLAQYAISISLCDDRQRSRCLQSKRLLAFLVQQLEELMKILEAEIVVSNEKRATELLEGKANACGSVWYQDTGGSESRG